MFYKHRLNILIYWSSRKMAATTFKMLPSASKMPPAFHVRDAGSEEFELNKVTLWQDFIRDL
jgi:hypothetical protein